jgi:DNA polymerase sigma
MQTKDQFLASVKTEVLQVLPDASVIIFGNKTEGTAAAESDWDILVLSEKSVTEKIRLAVYDKIFSLSVSIGAFIDAVIISKKDWQKNPSYTSHKKAMAFINQTM